MTISSSIIIFVTAILKTSLAYKYANLTGFGTPNISEAADSNVSIAANQHALNSTSIGFPGFNFDANASSPDNVTLGSWIWKAGISIIDVDSGEYNFPISSTTNITDSVINVAFSLNFPEGQLPEQDDTNWNLCSFVIDANWSDDTIRRAVDDPGDCSVVLGSSCMNAWIKGWQGYNFMPDGCPNLLSFASIDECSSIKDEIVGWGSSSLMSWYSQHNNASSPRVGLKSEQIYSYELSRQVSGADIELAYEEYATQIHMQILAFTPNSLFASNHSGFKNQGDVRTLCTILNKDKARQSNVAAGLKAPGAFRLWTAVCAVIVIWIVQ